MATTANTLNLVTALVNLPLTGTWHADIRVSPPQGDVETTPAFSGTVAIDLDGLLLTGTVLRSQMDDGVLSARVVGGKGGLSVPIVERYYRGSPTVRKIVEDILRDSKETLATDSNAGVLDTVLAVWHRVNETAGAALSRVLTTHAGSWRVKPDGSVLVVGAETWPIVEPPSVQVPGSDSATGYFRVAWKETTPTTVLPGITFQGQKIRHVVHELEAGKLRSELRFVEPRSVLERMTALVSKGAAYSRLLPAIVEKQNADGSLDVVVDNKYGLTQVPLRLGLPGFAAKMAQGSQVLVGFAADDPRQPVAFLFPDGSSSVEVIFEGGTKKVARVDDTVDFGTLSGTAPSGGGPVTFTWTPPGGGTPVVGVSINPIGKITSGAAKLKA